MTCPHTTIQSWSTETKEPVPFWSCVDCKEKFMPISQAWAETHAAVRRCVEITNCLEIAQRESGEPFDVCNAIRDEFPQAFTDTKD